MLRSALADPVLADGGREAAERRVGGVVGARDAQRGGGRGLGLELEVGEDVAHRGLVGEQAAEGRAVAGVVDGLRGPPADRGGRAEQAVEPRVVDHPDDRLDAAALLADEAARDGVELDLRRGQRARAQLVLEPLDPEAGLAALAAGALDQEAGEALVGLGERQEDVARGVGAEPLVAGDLPGPVAGRDRARGVGADVGAALLLGHRHPGDRPGAGADADAAGIWSIPRLDEPRLPLGGELRALA